MKKWTDIYVYYDDETFDHWTPDDLERMKFVAKELTEMLLRSAKKEEKP